MVPLADPPILEKIISILAVAIALGLVSGAVFNFRAGRRRRSIAFAVAAVVFLPAMLLLATALLE